MSHLQKQEKCPLLWERALCISQPLVEHTHRKEENNSLTYTLFYKSLSHFHHNNIYKHKSIMSKLLLYPGSCGWSCCHFHVDTVSRQYLIRKACRDFCWLSPFQAKVPLTWVNISFEWETPGLDSGERISCPWFQPEVEKPEIHEQLGKLLWTATYHKLVKFHSTQHKQEATRRTYIWVY